MNLTKKQVKAVLEIADKDYRPALAQIVIDELEGKPVLVATDSYRLIALELSDIFAQHIGKMIDKREMVIWTKLAGTRDYLTDEKLSEWVTERTEPYPKWQQIVTNKVLEPTPKFGINTRYLTSLADVAGTVSLSLNRYEGGLFTEQVDGLGLLVIMGLKV